MRNILSFIFTGLLFFSLAFCETGFKQSFLKIYYQYKQKHYPEIKDITIAQFLSLTYFKKALLVDVRQPAEMAVSVIPGAVPLDSLYRIPVDSRRQTPIVVYCTIGMRSGHIVQELSRKGLNAYNLAGGVLSWAAAGKFLKHENSPVKKIHVFSKEWNYLPEGYEAVF